MNTLAARHHDPRATQSLRTGLVVSALVHGSVVAALVMLGLKAEKPRPPVYRVELVGAPAGARQAGVVAPKAVETPAPTPTPAPSGAERVPAEKAIATKKAPAVATPKATPNPVPTKAAGAKSTTPPSKAADLPKAGSGRDGGKGADVRNVRIDGIAFPFPGYLSNIMRQVSLAYRPQRVSAALVAEVKFMIRRDGSVSGIEIVKSSGDRLFDLEARGTVESVGVAGSFGALPSGWTDDVLVVYFTFDYALRP